VLEELLNSFATDAEWTTKLIGPPEVLGVQDLAASSVLIRLVVTTVPGQQWKVGRELRQRVKTALDNAGIVIPYPQTTIHVKPKEPNT